MSGRPTRAQQDAAVESFVSITGASNKQAKSLLSSTQFDVSQAVEAWFTKGMVSDDRSSTSVDRSKMDAMFQKYKDDGADSMSIQGVLALAGDLSLEMTDLRVTILLAYFNFVKLTSTKTDFLKGLSELRCDNMTALGSKLAQLQDAMATDDALFKRVFEYSYVGNLEPGQKALKREIACMLLPVLLGARWPLTDDFVAFLNSTGQDRVSKDTWKTLVPFMKVLPNSGALAAYEDDGSWPVLMDEFIEFLQAGGAAAGAAGSS